MFKRLIALFACISFSINNFQYIYAQDLNVNELPAPGTMVRLSLDYDPPLLKGIKFHTDHPFQFDFILDKGDSAYDMERLKDESTRLVKYFLASLTVPDKDLWVNLSPYEKDRIVPKAFGVTQMGRDLLAEDYMLKQITASLIYPEDEVGKRFWKRVYEEAQKKYHTTDIPIDTFNKVWIVPEKAVVYENVNSSTAYVVEAKLKVMLEKDYLSLQKHESIQGAAPQSKVTNQIGSQIVREVIIPELTREVNEGRNFEQLRQVYYSLILAMWYKEKVKNSLFDKIYVDQKKTSGVDITDKVEKEKIWQRYVLAFKKGVFNYIKESKEPGSQQMVPRKYFSGGAGFYKIKEVLVNSHDPLSLPQSNPDRAMIVEVNLDSVTPKLGDIYTVALRNSPPNRNNVAKDEGVEVLDRLSARGRFEFDATGFDLALDMFRTGADQGGLIDRLSKLEGIEKVDWQEGVLSILTKTEVVKFHWKDEEINERMGLKDRFYIPYGPQERQITVEIYRRDSRDERRLKKGPVYVLGILRPGHDSGAALVKDGVLVGAIEEERLNMDKHTAVYFPQEAVRYLLGSNGLSWEDIDHIAIPFDYNFFNETLSSQAPHFDYRQKFGLPFKDSYRRYDINQFQSFLDDMAYNNGTGYIPPVTFVKHHKAHAAAAFYASGFTRPTLVFSIDGQGEDESTTVWLAQSGKLKRIARTTPFTHSLGHFYHIFTVYLGYQRNDEGKVMGYAPYGAPRNADEQKAVSALKALMNELIRFNRKSGQIEMNQADFELSKDSRLPGISLTADFLRRLAQIVPPMPEGKTGRDLTPEDRGRAHLAFAMQQRVEEVISDMVSYYLHDYPQTQGTKYVVMTGGLALNIVANGKLIENGIVDADKFFVPAYPADDGTMVGAALSVSDEEYQIQVQHKIEKISFGKTYTDAEIKSTLTAFNLVEGRDYEHIPNDGDLVNQVAQAIIADKTVAWFQGGAELGPRALGNRSILNRLNDAQGNLKVNRIKNREPWRPSALSIQQEHAAGFLEGIKASPFMTISFPVTGAQKEVIKAGVHAQDGSTRPQTVSQESNGLYWSLLKEMGQRTGVPGVLNTSFNRNGPMVETPEDALNTYYYGEGLDYLAMGHYLIKQKLGIRPSILNGKDEKSLTAFFKSGAYKMLNHTQDWDAFWDQTTRLAKSRGVSHQHYLIVNVAGAGGAKEVLRVPLLKEMFQAGTREYMIADLARRIENGIGDQEFKSIAIETTAPQYQEVVRDLFDRYTPDEIRSRWNIVSLGFGTASTIKLVQDQRFLGIDQARIELDNDIAQWKKQSSAQPMLVAVTGPDEKSRTSLISQLMARPYVIDERRWSVADSQRDTLLEYPFSDIQYDDYAVALNRLAQGKTALVPLGQAASGGLPEAGYLKISGLQKRQYRALLIKADSPVWLRFDGQLFEELLPAPGDVFIINSPIALNFPITRKVFRKSYFLGDQRTSDGLEELISDGIVPSALVGAPFADVLVRTDLAMSAKLPKTPWIPLARPQPARHVDKICVALTNSCPVSCLFCFMEAIKGTKGLIALDDRAITKLIEFIKLHRVDRILLSGGEPLLEIEHVLRVVREADLPYITLFTSGFFAKTPQSAQNMLARLGEALQQRKKAGLRETNVLFEVSHDTFHLRTVSQDNVINIVRAFEKNSKTLYAGLTLQIKGVLDEADPIPELIRRLDGKVQFVQENNSFPTLHVSLPSGYEFDVRYSEIKLLKKMLGTDLEGRNFRKIYRERLNNDVVYIGRGESEGITFSVNYDGVLSVNDYLAKNLVLGNINDGDFQEDFDQRFTRDPLVVALREIGLNAVLEIAEEVNPNIRKQSIATNNQFIAVAEILADPRTREYVYQKLIKMFETDENFPVSLLRKEVYVIGDGKIELPRPATVKGTKNQIRFQGTGEKELVIKAGNNLVLENAFLSLRQTMGPARVSWQGDTSALETMTIGDNVSILDGGELMNVPVVGNGVKVDGSALIEMDETGVGDRAKVLGNSEVRMSSIGKDVLIDQQSKILKAVIADGAKVINSSLIGGQDELVAQWRNKDEQGRGRGVIIGKGAEFYNGLAQHKGALEGKINPIIVEDGVKLDGVFLLSQHNGGIRIKTGLQLKPDQRVYVYDGVTVDGNTKQLIEGKLADFNIVKVLIKQGGLMVEGVAGDLVSENLLDVKKLKEEYATQKTKGIPKIFSIETKVEAQALNQMLRESDVLISSRGKILLRSDERSDIAVFIKKGTFVYPGVEFFVNPGRQVFVNVWDLGNRGGAIIIADKKDVRVGPQDRLAGRIVGMSVIRDVRVDGEFNNFGGIADNVEGRAKITIRNQGVLVNAHLSSDDAGSGEIIWGGYQGWNVDVKLKANALVGLAQGGVIKGQSLQDGSNSIKLVSGFDPGYRAAIIDSRPAPSGPVIFSSPLDAALTALTQEVHRGGIDFSSAAMKLSTKNDGGGIQFHPDMAQWERLKKVSGFIPVIINIQPMTNLRKFLGLGPVKMDKSSKV